MAALRRMFDRQWAIFRGDKAAAEKVCSAGQAPRNAKLDPTEHAALTAVCLALFNLDQALSHE